jgi:hypothetical protein
MKELNNQDLVQFLGYSFIFMLSNKDPQQKSKNNSKINCFQLKNTINKNLQK